MIYFDTSYLVRLYFRDLGWEAVRKLSTTDQIACGWHGHGEAIAAFHRKLREGAIQANHYLALLRQFAADDAAGAFHWIIQNRDTAARMALVYSKLPESTFLRAADAWHLATAAGQGFPAIYSSDSKLLVAAKFFALEGRNVF